MRFSHEICLFLMVVDIIYAFSRDTYPYYNGDIAIIYSFLHEICLFLRVVDIIYAFSIDTNPYYKGDVVIIYAFS